MRRIVGLACADLHRDVVGGHDRGLWPGARFAAKPADRAGAHPPRCLTIIERPVRRILQSATADNVEPSLADHRIVHLARGAAPRA